MEACRPHPLACPGGQCGSDAGSVDAVSNIRVPCPPGLPRCAIAAYSTAFCTSGVPEDLILSDIDAVVHQGLRLCGLALLAQEPVGEVRAAGHGDSCQGELGQGCGGDGEMAQVRRGHA